ncbi:hypothetical protein [Fibrobacter sp.]|uniref:hypothetical protein n=1 Tax=Fibrobacter sp. TaxID=35828 RepID=UPI00388DE5B7
MKDFVSKIPQNELIDFVATYAENHTKFLTALVARFAEPVNNKKKDTFIKQFDDIVKNHSDHGFIDYRASYGFEREMADFLGNLFENSSFSNDSSAMESITHFTKKFGNLQIDDSNGSMTYLCELLSNIWHSHIANANTENQIEIRKWIEQHMYSKNMWMMEDNLEDIYCASFNDEKNLKAKLKFYDKLIKDAEESTEQSYSREFNIAKWAAQKADVMEKLHTNFSDIEVFLMNYRTMQEPTFKLFDLYMKVRRFADAEKILLKFGDLKKDNHIYQREIAEKLKVLYTKTRQNDKLLEVVKNLVRDIESMELFKEFKSMISKENWVKERDAFLKTVNSHKLRMDIFKEEQLTDELYKDFCDIAKAGLTIYAFDWYGKALCPQYETQVVEFFRQYLDNEMMNATTRREYHRVVSEAKTLLTYNGGLTAVNDLQNIWQERHKNRPAMIEELKKLHLSKKNA